MKQYPRNPVRAIRTYLLTKTGRKVKLLTQQDLADMTGFTQGFVSKIENGILSPPVEFLGALLKEKVITAKKLIEIVEYYTAHHSPIKEQSLGHTDQTPRPLEAGGAGPDDNGQVDFRNACPIENED